MNPRKMQQMMKRMGIQQVEIPATEVIIKSEDKEIVITEPSVSKVNMMGKETFQISGQINEREVSAEPEIKEEDIKTVMEQANVDEEKAKEALEKANGDLAKAIMDLQNQ
jgi:nascent polypeptide-associated complex subunit alpha